MKREPWHRPEIQLPIRSAAVLDDVDDLILGPPPRPGFLIRCEVERDKRSVWIRRHTHAARKISVIAVDAGAIDLRVAQPAHFGVNEVLTSLQRVRAVPRTVQSSAWQPGRYSRN
jgi:hypothetical protein